MLRMIQFYSQLTACNCHFDIYVYYQIKVLVTLVTWHFVTMPLDPKNIFVCLLNKITYEYIIGNILLQQTYGNRANSKIQRQRVRTELKLSTASSLILIRRDLTPNCFREAKPIHLYIRCSSLIWIVITWYALLQICLADMLHIICFKLLANEGEWLVASL